MAQRTTTIAASTGLHARPASVLVKAATASRHAVTITVNGKSADAKSLLSVLTLSAAKGDDVVIEVEGDEADRVADELVTLLSTDLDAA